MQPVFRSAPLSQKTLSSAGIKSECGKSVQDTDPIAAIDFAILHAPLLLLIAQQAREPKV